MKRLALAVMLIATASTGLAQQADPPYEALLQRLAEVLGGLHYLRPLCGAANEGQLWRDQMEQLLRAEDPSGRRRDRLIERFNVGYSGFASVYRTCTPTAAAMAERYQREGAQLARDITTRYGR
jgi:uncharacterized protein (TIGR02301 family)